MFKHLVLKSAIESVKASEGPSDLYKDLIKATKDVFNAFPKDVKPETDDDIFKMFKKAILDTNYIKKIQSSVAKHLNFPKLKVTFTLTNALNASMQCSIDPVPKKNLPYHQEYNSSGISSTVESNNIFKNMIDPLAGEYTLDTKYQKYVKATLNIYAGWFLVPYFIPGMRSYTPEEIAAIILHELGHLVYLYSVMLAFYRYNDITTDILNMQNPTLASITNTLSFLKANMKAIDDNLTNITDLGDAELTKFVTEDTNVIKLALRDIETSLSDKTVDLSLIQSKLCFVMEMIKVYSGFLFSGLPQTALVETSVTQTIDERIADEFAVRNGAGAAAMTENLYTEMLYTKYLNDDSVYKLSQRKELIARMYTFALFFRTITDLSACEVVSPYDNFAERCRQLIETTYPILKQANLSDEDRKYYIDTIKTMQSLLDSYNKLPYVKIREKLYSLTSVIGTIAKAPFTIFLTKLGKDYTALQQFTTSLIRTPLSYHSTRLDLLSR